MRPNRNRIFDYLVVSLAPLCWAGDVVLARGVVGLIPPYSLAFWRWAIAFLILAPFTFSYVKKDWATAKQEWKMILLLSVLGGSVFISLIYTAVHTTSAINVALIQTAMPAAIVTNCLLFYREKISVIQLICLCVCFIGVCFVVLQGRLSNILGMSFVLGDFLMLMATMMYGLYSALLQRRAPKIHPLSLLTLFTAASAVVLLPVCLIEVSITGGFEVNVSTVTRILYTALFPSLLAYFCWNIGVATIGATRTGMLVNLLPVFASILAVVFLGEVFRWFHSVGMAMIISGLIVFNRCGSKPVKPMHQKGISSSTSDRLDSDFLGLP